ncbi:MAG: tetratricopeptide repeat protein, partial [Deltaproteobacteria bacterium]
PQSALAHNELGTLLFQLGRLDEAIAEFRAATQVDDSYALAFYNLGYASRKAAHYADAVPAYQRYIQLKPQDADGKFGLAECYRMLGQNQAAAATYEAYAQQETRPSERRWVEKALQYAAQLKQPPPPPPAPAVAPPAPSYAAPQAYGQSAPPVQAYPPQPTYGQAPTPVAPPVASNPVDALIAQGDQHLAANDLRGALYAYQDAARQNPSDARAHFKIGLAYAQLGYFPQAIDEWQRVLALDPGNQGAKDNIQKAEAKMGTAQQQATQATPPPVTDPLQAAQMAKQNYDQAVQLIQQRRYADAVTTLTAAIQLKPDFAVAYVARGSAFVGLGRFQDAVQDYLRGLSLNGNQAAPLFGLGEAYRGMGDRTRAAQYYQACASSSAPDADPLRDLARRRYSELLQ